MDQILNRVKHPRPLITPVLLAGGQGTRLWPLSRSSFPKQLLPFKAACSLLQETAKRVQKCPDNGLFTAPIVVADVQHRFIIEDQLRDAGIDEAHIILEPHARNTAPALTVAALLARKHFPGSHLLVLPADHVITSTQQFIDAVKRALRASVMGRLVLFGIAPTLPSPAYGYIKSGQPLWNLESIHDVHGFTEKPDAATAQRYLAQGSYLWNAGVFLLPVTELLDELRHHAGSVFAAASQAFTSCTQEGNCILLGNEAYAACTAISIDNALMEHTQQSAVVPVEFEWLDVGSWSSLYESSVKDDNGNAVVGTALITDCARSYVRSEGPLLAVIGMTDMVIISTSDAVLVAPAGRDQDIKHMVARLRNAGHRAADTSSTVHRPWGTYTVIDEGDSFKVKRLNIRPGAALSLQLHRFRSENWVVVSGTALVTREQESLTLNCGGTVFIPAGAMHRLENPLQTPLIIIETQLGSRICEDDIIRFDDKYGR
jgi:mannose-1-phosphate guanylyltransferase/mannose-6-phosphate isomerase